VHRARSTSGESHAGIPLLKLLNVEEVFNHLAIGRCFPEALLDLSDEVNFLEPKEDFSDVHVLAVVLPCNFMFREVSGLRL